VTLREAVTEMIGGGEVLLGIDFDGTLAPLVDHPDLAMPDPEGMSILRALAERPGLRVAVVSGRAFDDLSRRLDLPGVVLIGEHGNDTGGEAPMSPALDEARAFIMSVHASVPGSAVEDKPRSVTFHTRMVRSGAPAAVVTSVRDWVDAHDGVVLLEGKDVLELTVGSRSKGEAILELARESDGVIYIGDDVTDENVFARLGPDDIGVKVGAGPTAARYRLDDVAGVVGLLKAIDVASTSRR
jgi:trehalose-phosphatase